MKQKMITIRFDQEDWLEENNINISKLVRKIIDEKMKTWNTQKQ